MDFESQYLRSAGEWSGPNALDGIEADVVLPASFGLTPTLDFAGATSQLSETADQSQLTSQFDLNNFSTDTDFGGLDIYDGLLGFESHVVGDATVNLSPTASQIYPSGGFL
jgi:hypothetical protein